MAILVESAAEGGGGWRKVARRLELQETIAVLAELLVADSDCPSLEGVFFGRGTCRCGLRRGIG